MAYLQREPYRNEFISSLYTILHNSSNSSIVYTALGILGHLGGKSRSTLKGVISLPCVEPSSGFRVVADAGGPFGLDGVLYSMPVSDVLTFIISGVIIIKTYGELNEQGVAKL